MKQLFRATLVFCLAVWVVACNAILGNEKRHLLNAACVLNSDCPAHEVCLFKVCSIPCRQDVDCPNDYRCLKTDDGSACVATGKAKCSDGACPAGTRCVNGDCRTACGAVDAGGATTSGCNEDQTCVAENVCVGSVSGHDPGLSASGTDGGLQTGGRPGSGGTSGTGGAVATGGTGGAAGAGGLSAAGGTGVIGPDAAAGGSNDTGGLTGSGGSASGGLTGSGGQPGDSGTTSCPNGTVDLGAGCLKMDAQGCTVDNECANGQCVGQVCCHAGCAAPGKCQTTPVTCSDGVTCAYANRADHAACDDGDPCTLNECSNGLCIKLGNVDCTSLDDSCNLGVCSGATGTCGKQPRNSGGACTNGITACDKTGKCNASGSCIGQNDACGALAASCATCTTGAGCYQGRNCTCQTAAPPNVVANGVCVKNTDECSANPCLPPATACVDPTPNGTVSNDFQCTCPAGYAKPAPGVGTCTDTNECSPTNPCGAGRGTCNNTLGAYTCGCNAGFTSISTATGPTCVCDLSGSWGVMTTRTVTWPAITSSGVTVIEGATGVPVYTWALRANAVAADGAMTMTTIPCGGTTPVLCDKFFGFAHGQYVSNHIAGKSQSYGGAGIITMSAVGVYPGGAYSEPTNVALLGITLQNPAGPWPACAACVGIPGGSNCTCSTGTKVATNAATWLDVEADGQLGVTVRDIPRGGLSNDTPINYTEPSVCPRTGTGQATYGFSEWYGVDGVTTFRAYQWYGASRTISALQGTAVTVAAGSCSITGNVTGPSSGHAQIDARIRGCGTCASSPTTSCTGAGACTPSQTTVYDGATNTTSIQSETFTLSRLGGGTNLATILAMADGAPKETAIMNACNQFRIATCPLGETCSN